MFHLLSSLYTDLTSRPRYNILFLGSESSGKSTLLQTIKSHYLERKALERDSSAATRAYKLPKTRATVGQNVLDIAAPAPSNRPLVKPAYPPPDPTPPTLSEVGSSSSWFSPSRPAAPRRTSTSTGSGRKPSKAILHIWDLGGEQGLRPIWKKYYAETDCVVWFWDCSTGGKGKSREAEWDSLGEDKTDGGSETVRPY